MTFPAGISTVQVVGSFFDGGTRPEDGEVIFTPSAWLEANGVIIVKKPVVGYVRAGVLDVTLVATDDADVQPAGWHWKVSVNVGGRRRAWAAFLPSTPDPVDLEDLAPIEPVEEMAGYATLVQLTAEETARIAGDNALDARVDVLEGGGGGSGTPTGPAGGALAGTYPNPTLSAGTIASFDPAGAAAAAQAAAISAAATDATIKVANHTSASDPHGDRANTTAQVAAHEADTTNVHGIADTAALETQTGATAKVTTHTGATDPHGDRAYADTGLAGKAAVGHSHSYPVTSVNTETGAVVLDAADVGAVDTDQVGAANGVASLDGDGKVPAAQLPGGGGTVLSVNGESGHVVLDAADVSAIPAAEKGANSGVATLDAGGDVPLVHLGNVPAPPVTSVNTETGAVVLDAADVGAATAGHNHDAAYIAAAEKGAANGVATLGADSKIPASQLAAIAISEYLGAVGSQAAMLALTGQRGDWATRTDSPNVGAWILVDDDASQLANWVRVPAPADAVLSVNTQTGVVVLTATDVGLGNVNNTSDANKPVSTAQQTALDLKANNSAVVHNTGAETVAGAKSFTNGVGAGTTNDGSAFIMAIATALVQGLRIQGANASDLAFTAFVAGDSQLRFLFRTDGLLTWGDGSAVADTNLYRAGANQLKTDDTLLVGTPGTVAGSVATIDGTQTLTNKSLAGESVTSGTVAAARLPDATTGAKGIVQLAGDLAGTAAAPTVPGLAGKAATSHAHSGADITSGTVAANRIADLSATYLTVAAFGTQAVLLAPAATQTITPLASDPTLQSTQPYSAADDNEDFWQFFAGLSGGGSVKTFWLNGNNEPRSVPSTQNRVGLRAFEHPEAQGYSTGDFFQASTNPTDTGAREALLAVRGSGHATEAGYVVATRRFKAPTVEATTAVVGPNIGAKVTASTSAPSSPATGDIWIDIT